MCLGCLAECLEILLAGMVGASGVGGQAIDEEVLAFELEVHWVGWSSEASTSASPGVVVVTRLGVV